MNRIRTIDLIQEGDSTVNQIHSWSTRRLFLKGFVLSAASLYTPGVLAQELDRNLVRTPAQTEGPFYPDRLPLDTDNDLIIVNNSVTPAVGEITHLSGRILSANGSPIRNATVEIWQVDNNAAYIHSQSSNRDRRDTNFQGFGRFLTGSTGEYYFRTIKPVPYPGRTPHIHFKVKVRGQRDFITQCYIRGEARNGRDGIYVGIRDQRARESVTVEFAPLAGSRIRELQARFDIVLGFTPEG
jgi:protocatechuate 3,4-dioxygenase beta subunit